MTTTRFLRSLARRAPSALVLAAAPAVAQAPSVPFPLQPSADASALGAYHDPDLVLIERLTRLDEVTLTDVLGPGGAPITLSLERIDTDRRRFDFRVDDTSIGDPSAALDLTIWRGAIAGDPFSDVLLGFSTHGCHGWIKSRDGLLHVLAAEAAGGGWGGARAVLATEADLNAAGHAYEGDCSARPPLTPVTPPSLQPADLVDGLEPVDTIALRECSIAMETDHQLYQIWNDTNAATAYLTTLFSFISDRYEAQASTALTFPYVQLYTTPNDPWSVPDDPNGTTGQMLDEFRSAWQGNIPSGARLGHFLSGAGLGGGIAYLDVLCNNSFNFGVSANLAGQVNFPVVQQPANWDFIVISHEIGHNFSSPHTHDFCPPLDECAPSGYFGSCQTTQTCSNSGTIMSYCHLCSGGTGNITTYFHPEAAALMTAASAACNPALFEVAVDPPSLISEGIPATVTLEEVVGDVSSATLIYSVDGGVPVAVAMAPTANGFAADLPAVDCGQFVEYTIDFDVAGFGAFTAPADAPSVAYEAVGGTLAVAFEDDFESDLGWSTEVLGASSGQWQRGVPVDDPGWSHDPAADFDGSGACFLTQNEPGNTDVDDGAVRLTSPTFALPSANARVAYAYYLKLTNSNGADRLLVEALTPGGGWVEVARHETDGGLAWREADLDAQALAAAGITPGATTRFRFTANDDNPQSIVEAGVDAFRVTSVDCGLGSSFCGPAAPNVTGVAATIRAEGSAAVADNDVLLVAEDLPPGQFGMFVTSQTQGFTPGLGGGPGTLCLGGALGRFTGSLSASTSGGELQYAIDLGAVPQGAAAVAVVPGDTWSFQAWYRDVVAGSPSSNLTDGLQVTFQ